MNEVNTGDTAQHETFSREVLKKISEAYGLSELQFVENPEHGLITENAVIRDESGKRYFVKWYKTENIEKHASTYRAAEIVATNPEIPVSLPLMPNNSSYTVTINGKSLTLFPYIEHSMRPYESATDEERLIAGMSENLGKIHAVIVPPGENLLRSIDRWQPGNREKRTEILEKIKVLIEQLPLKSKFDELALHSVTTKLKLLLQLPQQEQTETDLRICHGDYHTYNTLHDDDMGIVAIIDWDNAGLADPNVDFLHAFLTLVVGNVGDAFQTKRGDIAQIFVSNYQKGLGADIDIASLENAYHTLMHERIGSSWPMYQHYFEGDIKNDNRVERGLHRSIGIVEHYDEVLDFILQSVSKNKKKGTT